MIKKLFYLSSRTIFFLVLFLFVSIVFYIFYKFFLGFNIDLLKSELLGAILGTFYLVFLSVVIVIPLGISTAIFIEFYARKKLKFVLDFIFELLASMPSIIIGLFGFSVLLILHNYFPNIRSSLLLASLSLAILILPYIVKSTQLGIQETPKRYMDMLYSLGASKENVILKVVLPFAKEHIKKGVFLSIARSAEDTAVIMLTGVVASYGSVKSIFAPFEALPFYIYYVSENYESQLELDSIYIAIIMLMFISSLFMFFVGNLSKDKVWLR